MFCKEVHEVEQSMKIATVKGNVSNKDLNLAKLLMAT